MSPETFDLERDGPWLSAYVDGELPAADAARVEAWLAASEEARRETARLRAFAALTASFALREAPAEAWEMIRAGGARRRAWRLGWLLLALGVLVVGGWAAGRGLLALWRDPELPVLVKLGVSAAAAGVLVLLGCVARERVLVRARTRYADVVR